MRVLNKIKKHPYISSLYFFIFLIASCFLIVKFFEIGFFLNTSNSSPYTLFIGHKTQLFERDMYVVAFPDSEPVKKYLDDTPLIKKLIGVPQDDIHISNNNVYLNQKYVGIIQKSKTGAHLSGITEKIIPEDYYFLISDNTKDGFDSRYAEFGLIKKENLKYQVWPIF